jgi:hypothetical protein
MFTGVEVYNVNALNDIVLRSVEETSMNYPLFPVPLLFPITSQFLLTRNSTHAPDNSSALHRVESVLIISLLYLVQNNGNSVYLYLDDGAPGSSEM